MGKTKIVVLNETQKAALERGWREGASHAFRQRCRLVLLKSEGRTSRQVAALLGCCEMAVNNWLKRFADEDLPGLQTRPGRGGKPILQGEEDLEKVRAAVQKHRQRLSQAKAELEAQLGKSFSQKTLTRFLKKTIAATNDLESWANASRLRKFTNSRKKV
jgi:transposase